MTPRIKNTLINILFSTLTCLGVLIIVYNFVPLSWIEKIFPPRTDFGATITTIQGTDLIRDSRAVINTNFSNLNTDKMEVSTTSVNSITTLSNLVTVGTITTGTWNGDTLTVGYGGTGSTTLSQYRILLGSSTNPIGLVESVGTSGQFLTSQGAGLPPHWTTAAVDQALDYNWTGTTRIKNLHASSTAANPMYLNGIDYAFPATEGASSTIMKTNGSGTIIWDNADWVQLGETTLTGASASTTVTGFTAKTDIRIVVSSEGLSSARGLKMVLNNDRSANYGYRTYEDYIAVASSNAASNIVLSGNSTTSPQYFVIDIKNVGAKRKLITYQGVGSISGSVLSALHSGAGVWNNTSAQITTVYIDNTDSDPAITLAAGTRVTVYGKRD